MNFKMLEEGYKVQYLYNAISEYLYISIILIENYGPQNVNELEKFSMFFKTELNSFVEIFKGETKSKKIINLISTVTTAFDIQDEIVSLSKNYEKCKRTIFQELMQSNVSDIILRGITSIKDICKCINLNSAVHIKEDTLLHMLRQNSLFQIEDDSSVTILEFTGLIGYDDNLYKTITDYFQSYLLKVSSITFNEINLHDSFILSCGIKSSLVMLCVFYIDEMFKCKNNKVKVRKNWKDRSKNQLKVQMDQFNFKDSISVSKMVFNLYGFTIKNFKGEITRVNKTMGYIQGIVEVKSFVGVFPVFFNMSALKLICGTDNLVDFVSLEDSVEFDAEYCDETRIEDRYWKATLVKVTRKSILGRNKYQVNFDTEEYTEKRLVKEKFKRVPKSLNGFINSPNQRQYSSLNNISRVKENLLSNKEINPWKSELKIIDSPHDDKSCSPHELSPTEVSQGDASNKENIKDASIKVLSRHDLHKSSLSTDIHKTLNENCPLTLETDKMDLPNFLTTCPEENLIVKNIPITGSSFMFGEILVITDKEGIAISLSSAEQYEVYFKKQSVLYLEDAEFSPQEGSKVLLFLPYGLNESSISVATLVYVLDEEESSLVDGNYEWVDDFVVEYFIPKLKLRYPNYIDCFCNFGFSFSSPSQNFCEELSFPDLLNDLGKVFTYNGNTGKNFLNVLKLHLQNLKIDKKKWASFQTSIFSSIDSNIEYSHPKKGQKLIKHRENMIKKLDAVSSTINENIFLSLPSMSVKEVQTENPISFSTDPTKDNMLSTKVNSRNPSPSSLSSYVSCDIVSDDEFFSLESTSSKSSLNQDSKSKNLALLTRKNSPETEISSPENEEPSTTNKSKNRKIVVPSFKQTCRLKNLLSSYKICQCQYKTVESTASISTITDKCFFVEVKDNKDVALSFPMCLIPEENQDQIKFNSKLNISFALHQLVQLSQILFLKFKLNNNMLFCNNHM